MEEIVYGPCRFLIHPVYFPQLFHRCLPDFLQRLELTHQCFSPGLADIRDIIQHRMNLLFAAQGTMILDSKPMCLVLDTGNQPKTFGMPVNGNFLIIKIQSSGSVYNS